jgi:hypothetical protein
MSADEADASIDTKMTAMHGTGVLKQKAIISTVRLASLQGGVCFLWHFRKRENKENNQTDRLHIDRLFIDSKMNMGGK